MGDAVIVERTYVPEDPFQTLQSARFVPEFNFLMGGVPFENIAPINDYDKQFEIMVSYLLYFLSNKIRFYKNERRLTSMRKYRWNFVIHFNSPVHESFEQAIPKMIPILSKFLKVKVDFMNRTIRDTKYDFKDELITKIVTQNSVLIITVPMYKLKPSKIKEIDLIHTKKIKFDKGKSELFYER